MPRFESPDSLPVRAFSDASKLEQWFESESERADGLWIALAKKSSGVPSVTYHEAVESALCFGWIDGQKRSFDETFFLLRFTPRRARSNWTVTNQAKAAELIALGRMRAPGLRAIELAKADGRWESS